MDSDQLTLLAVSYRAREQYPHQLILTREGDRVRAASYEQFFARVDRLAWALQSVGVRAGDRIATIAWNHQRHLELYFAVPCSGAVLHTINLRLQSEQVRAIIEHASDSLVFIDSDCLPQVEQILTRVPSVRNVVVIGGPGGTRDRGARGAANWLDYEALLASQDGVAFPFDRRLEERSPAVISYSSATTGRPKGVVYSHRALYLHAMMLGLADTWALSEQDTILPVVPMFHVNAWGIPFTALWMGARLVLPGARPQGGDVLRLLRDEHVTFAAGVPTVWADVFERMRTSGDRLADLRMIVSGGAPMTMKLLKAADELGVPLVHSYGMTEATPLVLVGAKVTHPREGVTTDAGQLRRLAQGRLVPGLRMSVRDDSGAEVPTGGVQRGELWLGGPWVAESYERDERSKQAFRDGWYRSGDIVTVDEERYVRVVDRAADLIKSGGEWISTIDLENVLADHPAVRAAAVVGVEDERWQERPVAFVVLDGEVSVEDLRAHLEARVPKWWIPERFVELESLPQTLVGKCDKKALRDIAASGSSVSVLEGACRQSRARGGQFAPDPSKGVRT